MKTRTILAMVVTLGLLATALPSLAQDGPAPSGVPLGTAFTYQGFLARDGAPLDDTCDFRLALWDDPAAGNLIAGPLEVTGVAVSEGRFAVRADPGEVWDGTTLWLELEVQCSGDGGYSAPFPRQELTAAPYAGYARSTGALQGQALSGAAPEPGEVLEWDGSAWAPAIDDGTAYSAGEGLILTGTVFSADTGYLQRRVTPGCAEGYAVRAIDGDGSVVCQEVAAGGWRLTGNAGTNPANVFVGTTDAHALVLRTNDTERLRISATGEVGLGTDPVTNRPLTIKGIGDDSVWLQFQDSNGASQWHLNYADGGLNFVESAVAEHRLFLQDGGNVGINTSSPGARLDVKGGSIRTDGQLMSTVAEGTAPLAVASTTQVDNLNADLLDGQQGSDYQARVSGACAVGSTIRAINADGTVVCEAGDPLGRSTPPQANVVTAVVTAGDTGYHPSVTIGADGLPVVTFYDATYGLHVLHCGSAACTDGNTVTNVDPQWSTGRNSSIAIGADGLPVVSYHQTSTVSDLKVLHCGNAACTSGNTITAVDTEGNVGQYTSIAIGADGLPVVSYYDSTNQDLKVLHCGNAACTSGNTITTVDSAGWVGTYSSIAISPHGRPVVSYFADISKDLKVLHCGNAACTSGNTITVVDGAGDVGLEGTSIAFGADGLPVVSYHDATNNHLKVLHCGNPACTSGNVSTAVDTSAFVGEYSSITIGSDGLPVVSYYDSTNGDLRVLHCANAACNGNNTAITVDTPGNVGWFTSITIGTDGYPLISYFDDSNNDLRVLDCSSPFCLAYWRRR